MRVANRCSNPSCGRPTSGPHTDSSKSVNIGVAAHITAASAGGPRYDASLTSEERADARNGIWLCGACERLVDRDDPKYTKELLFEWKARAEAVAAQALEALDAVRGMSHVLDPAVSRSRDIDQLREVLNSIHMPTFDDFIICLQRRRINDEIFDYFYSFEGRVTSSLFHCYDPELRKRIVGLYEAWGRSLSYSDWFTEMPGGRGYRFMRQHEGNNPERWPEAAAAFDESASKVDESYRELINFVRAKFPEIDLADVSREAKRRNDEWHQRFERSTVSSPDF